MGGWDWAPPEEQPQPPPEDCAAVVSRARLSRVVAISSASGRRESCSALLNARCALSRRKKRTNVATRQRLIVRVRGMTAMVGLNEGWTVGSGKRVQGSANAGFSPSTGRVRRADWVAPACSVNWRSRFCINSMIAASGSVA